MKEHPILFSGPMVRAILEGRKTQTRRVVKWPKTPAGHDFDYEPNVIIDSWPRARFNDGTGTLNERAVKCPYGAVGDRLWVRETFTRVHPGMLQSLDPDPDSPHWETVFRADYNGGYVHSMLDYTKWRPSIFMPRKLSRITLEITDVRVERVQGISRADAIAESIYRDGPGGCWIAPGTKQSFNPKNPLWHVSPELAFSCLFDSINGKKHPWSSNPWVWVVEFRKI